jgi:hypothetical protein
MSFDDPSLWSLRYLQNFNSANIGSFYPPIPPFTTPVLTDKIIRVRMTSTQAQSNWVRAGKVSQIVNTGGVDTVTESIYLRLDESQLWRLPTDLDSYFLKITVPKYFRQATFSIFGFTGSL